MSDKLVSGGLLFTAVSFLTYQFINGHKPVRKQYKTNMQPIKEEEIIEEIIKTPSNTLENTPKKSPNLKEEIETFELNDTSPLLIQENENFQDIINNMNNMVNKETNSNSISSFLELYNTGSLTNTDDLEFTKINNSDLLKKLIDNKEIYGKPTNSLDEEKTDSLENMNNVLSEGYNSDSELIIKRKKKYKLKRNVSQ